MPHDADGNLLSPGDEVMIPATILSIAQGDEFCNCDLELKYPMPPYEEKQRYSAINTRQVVKALVAGQAMTAGEIAYGAYRDATDGKSLVSGQPIPVFVDLPLVIQMAWEKAAAALRCPVAKLK